jgi:LmbE family N-acetylglucosaminyl deacetylase
MIVPLIEEDDWLRVLGGVAPWQPGTEKMVVVAPHPDDETLAAGGLIAMQREAGVEVVVVAVTDGEHAYEENLGLGELRDREQAAALGRLGVGADRIVRLKMVDSGVAAAEPELVQRLMPLVSAKTHLVAPWPGDFHPDHEACGRAEDRSAADLLAFLDVASGNAGGVGGGAAAVFAAKRSGHGG